MSLPWIKVFNDLPDHPKSQDLSDLLGEPRAWTYMVQLWLWCAKYAEDGRISVRTESAGRPHVVQRTSRAAGWTSEGQRFVDAAVAVGFLVWDGEDAIVVCGWTEYQGAHAARKEADKERKRKTRTKEKQGLADASAGRPQDTLRTSANVRALEERRGEEIRGDDKQPSSAAADRVQPSPEQQELGKLDGGDSAHAVFSHWCVVMQKTQRTALDAKRRRAIEARLKDGYTVADLCLAVDGCKLTPHNMGQNDRGEAFNDIELICRTASNVDRFMGNEKNPPRPPEKKQDYTKGVVRAETQDWSNEPVGIVKDWF